MIITDARPSQRPVARSGARFREAARDGNSHKAFEQIGDFRRGQPKVSMPPLLRAQNQPPIL
jgi:hypothetical protein